MFFITEESLNFHKTFGIPYNTQDCGLNETQKKLRQERTLKYVTTAVIFRKAEYKPQYYAL